MFSGQPDAGHKSRYQTLSGKGRVEAARANLEGCKLGITNFSDCLNAS